MEEGKIMKKINSCSCSGKNGNVWVVEGYKNPFGWCPIFIAMTRKEARSRKGFYEKTRIRKYFSEDVMKSCLCNIGI